MVYQLQSCRMNLFKRNRSKKKRIFDEVNIIYHLPCRTIDLSHFYRNLASILSILIGFFYG